MEISNPGLVKAALCHLTQTEVNAGTIFYMLCIIILSIGDIFRDE